MFSNSNIIYWVSNYNLYPEDKSVAVISGTTIINDLIKEWQPLLHNSSCTIMINFEIQQQTLNHLSIIIHLLQWRSFSCSDHKLKSTPRYFVTICVNHIFLRPIINLP
jgi:hypothetical protein